MAVTHVLQCPAHGDFDLRRPMSAGGRPAPCPACGTSCPQVVRFNPQHQLCVSSRFGVTIPTTGWKGQYGGGDWENLKRDYNRWDSPFAGPLPGGDLPPEMR